MGEPSGIAPEITLKAWLQRNRFGAIPFAFFGDPDLLKSTARRMDLDVPTVVIGSAGEASTCFERALPVVPIALASQPQPGRPDPANADAVIFAVKLAVEAISNGEADAIVTNPIAKSVLYDSGFAHPGHTEFLGALADKHWPSKVAYNPIMMLVSDELRVVPVTIHIPLKEVPQSLTVDRICGAGRTTHMSLRNLFGIERPRLAVCGLNPHAGENGKIGREDLDIVSPAIEILKGEGQLISGPHPADTLFQAERRKSYDAVLAMYHDQALIPLKALAFDTGVNITLGLPFVRTSPDHGTAVEIAGTGTASPASLIASLRAAAQMARRRM